MHKFLDAKHMTLSMMDSNARLKLQETTLELADRLAVPLFTTTHCRRCTTGGTVWIHTTRTLSELKSVRLELFDSVKTSRGERAK